MSFGLEKTLFGESCRRCGRSSYIDEDFIDAGRCLKTSVIPVRLNNVVCFPQSSFRIVGFVVKDWSFSLLVN